MADQKTEQKIEEIRKRLEEYHKHKNDPHAYFSAEIKETRTFFDNAPEDIEFLLNEVKRLRTLLASQHIPSWVVEK